MSSVVLACAAPSVGGLIKLAIEGGRNQRPGMEIGICGEHGGDPESVALCHELGLDYVSCSPFRVLVARMAAAEAAINDAHHGDIPPSGMPDSVRYRSLPDSS